MVNNYLKCLDYKGHERNENGFSKFTHNGEYYFSYTDESGSVILRSEGYKTENTRDNGILSASKNMEMDERYKTIQLGDGMWVLSLRAANHQEIAQTCPVNSEEEALSFLPSRRAATNQQRIADLQKNKTDDYLICREYEERIHDSKSSIHNEFIEFKHANGKYYFAWIKNAKVFLRSEGYPSSSSRNLGLESVLRNKDDKNNYRTESAHGAHFLVLLAENNHEIARSCPKENEIEPFIALNLISETSSSIDSSTVELKKVEEPKAEIPKIKEDKIEPSKIEPKIEDKKEEDKKINPTTIDTSNVKEPAKMVTSPLLDSFKSEVPKAEPKIEPSKEETLKTEEPKAEEIKLDTPKVEPLKVEKTETKLPNIDPNSKEILSENEEKVIPTIKSEKSDIISDSTKDFYDIDSNEGGLNLKWLWLLLGILLISGLLWWLLKMDGCNKIKNLRPTQAIDSTQSTNVNAIADTSLKLDSTSLAVKAVWDSTLGKMVPMRLPDGATILVPENGSEKKLIEYLESKCGTSELKKTWFEMDRILFKTGSAELEEVSNEQLIMLAKIFKAYPNKKFKIGGYTDNQGDPEVNIKISAARAASAARGIAINGVDSTRMRSEGYGQEHPLCPQNDTEECRAKNRRIAIRVDVCK